MYKFHHILKSVLWGGDRIAAFKGIDTAQRQIGESWEVSGVPGKESVVASGPDAGLTLPELIARHREALVGADVFARHGTEFPLLVKLIDAERDLSLQVHPGDELAARRHGCQGKTEMWHIIEAAEGADILAGFARAIDASRFEAMTRDGSIMQAVKHYPSHSGDTFFLPPGTIHSIGAGNLLAEIQQASDITYRVYDHNRRDAMGNLRELHTALALEALDMRCDNDHRVTATGPLLVSCPHFAVARHAISGTTTLPLAHIGSFVVVLCIDGNLVVTCAPAVGATSATDTLRRGESMLLPACATTVQLDGRGIVLTTWVP